MSAAKYMVAGFAGARLLEGVFRTTRIRVLTEQPDRELVRGGTPVIYAPWHGRLLPLIYVHRHQKITALISRSGDGEYLAQLMRQWGYGTARGSSKHGGSTGLRELVRATRAGHSLAITPDGPRGPRETLKRGILTAAQLTGSPLIPVTAAATKAWWIEGWDRFLVPRPFSTIYVRYGAPIYVARNTSEAQMQQLERSVEGVLKQLTRQVDADAERH